MKTHLDREVMVARAAATRAKWPVLSAVPEIGVPDGEFRPVATAGKGVGGDAKQVWVSGGNRLSAVEALTEVGYADALHRICAFGDLVGKAIHPKFGPVLVGIDRQATIDEIREMAVPADWPSADQAKAYLTLKGYREAGGVWTPPTPDHEPTAKQAACLRVLAG